jgi:hypothetical protein
MYHAHDDSHAELPIKKIVCVIKQGWYYNYLPYKNLHIFHRENIDKSQIHAGYLLNTPLRIGHHEAAAEKMMNTTY